MEKLGEKNDPDFIRFGCGVIRCHADIEFPKNLDKLDKTTQFTEINRIRGLWCGETVLIEDSYRQPGPVMMRASFVDEEFVHVESLLKNYRGLVKTFETVYGSMPV